MNCPDCGSRRIKWDKDSDCFECKSCGCYFDPPESDTPDGCAACGGPYPRCMTSCKMFDD